MNNNHHRKKLTPSSSNSNDQFNHEYPAERDWEEDVSVNLIAETLLENVPLVYSTELGEDEAPSPFIAETEAETETETETEAQVEIKTLTLEEIIGDPTLFLDQLFQKINDIEFNVENFEMDHICYRVETTQDYRQKKEQLKAHGRLLIESLVNGRMISTFKLHKPIQYKKRRIFLIELPAPKATHSYKNGLEHAEFVTKMPLAQMMSKYPQYAFEAFGIHKKINADITLKLGEYCIRFHNQSLEDVIRSERKLSVNTNYNSAQFNVEHIEGNVIKNQQPQNNNSNNSNNNNNNNNNRSRPHFNKNKGKFMGKNRHGRSDHNS